MRRSVIEERFFTSFRMTASDCRSLFSCQGPLCHPRRLSPTPVPDLIGDPVKKWIQSSKGSSVVAFSFSQPTTLDSCFRRIVNVQSFVDSFCLALERSHHPAQYASSVILSEALVLSEREGTICFSRRSVVETTRFLPSKDPSQNSGRTQDRRYARNDHVGVVSSFILSTND